MRRVVLLFNQSNTFGLSQDAALLETALKHISGALPPDELAEFLKPLIN